MVGFETSIQKMLALKELSTKQKKTLTEYNEDYERAGNTAATRGATSPAGVG